MMTKVADRNRKGKRTGSGKRAGWAAQPGERLHVGIDVHKKSYHVAVWSESRRQIVGQWVTAADGARMVEQLEPLRRAIVHVVYEAGPTGYWLARMLRQAGLAVDVIAPSKTPRAADDSAKSDGLDCRQLAEYSAKGLLKSVAIPTPQQEADRQVVRMRQMWVAKRRRVQQQIKSLLLQHGVKEPEGLGRWTKASVEGLKNLPLVGQLRFCLDLMIQELEQLDEQLQQIRRQMEQLSRTDRLGPAVATLTTHPGVGMIVALSLATELHQAGAFANGAEVGKYVGLAPRVCQSGQTRRDGPISRTGRPELRAVLVQAAWVWVRVDPAARKVFNRLLGNTGVPQKAITAMARRLTIRLWRMLVTGQVYSAAA
jgi:transposase